MYGRKHLLIYIYLMALFSAYANANRMKGDDKRTERRLSETRELSKL